METHGALKAKETFKGSYLLGSGLWKLRNQSEAGLHYS